MELENVMQNASWTVLEALASDRKSPSQIAKEKGISLASISQQAKLLSAYNLITLQKTVRKGPGKPKHSYSLSKELAYVAMVRKGYAAKRNLRLDDYHKTLLNVLFYEKGEDHYFLYRFLHEREELIALCDAVAVSDTHGREIHLLVIAEEEHLDRLRKELNATIKHGHDRRDERKVVCWSHTMAEMREGLAHGDEYFRKLIAKMHVLVDSENALHALRI